MVSGGEFSHWTAPDSEGAPSSTGRISSAALGFTFIIIAELAAIMAGLSFMTTLGSRLASVITAGLSPLAGFAATMAGPPFMTTVGSLGLAFIIIAGLSPLVGSADITAGPPFTTTVGSVGLAFIIIAGLSPLAG